MKLIRRVPLSRHTTVIFETTDLPRVLCRTIGQFAGRDVAFEIGDTIYDNDMLPYSSVACFKQYDVVSRTACTITILKKKEFYFVTANPYVVTALLSMNHRIPKCDGQCFVVNKPFGYIRTVFPLSSENHIKQIYADTATFKTYKNLWSVPTSIKKWTRVKWNTTARRFEIR
jgi:hypothetical protein